jgi:hypothetical protein
VATLCSVGRGEGRKFCPWLTRVRPWQIPESTYVEDEVSQSLQDNIDRNADCDMPDTPDYGGGDCGGSSDCGGGDCGGGSD